MAAEIGTGYAAINHFTTSTICYNSTVIHIITRVRASGRLEALSCFIRQRRKNTELIVLLLGMIRLRKSKKEGPRRCDSNCYIVRKMIDDP
jgi:hypothetical protein